MKKNKRNKMSEKDEMQMENPINGDAVEEKENLGDSPAEKAEDSEELTPEEHIAQLEQQVADLKNAMLYKVAEFENYRKRTIKEKADLILNGGKKVMEALLPVADDLERAEENIAKATDVEALKEGLLLVFQKFTKTLEGLGLKKMDAVGADFSTDYHEAVAFVPAQSDEQKGKVIDCVQNGYMLNEQVIRFAKVAVGQ
ncbi:MAG: nucleotide exchange factor GrpE [Bacteroidaceae bacterium]|nr:nucleotide exchange factor GrpE [Bacteroidaceae bacterium]